MTDRMLAALLAASLTCAPLLTGTARADNQMGYRLLTAQEAAGLPRNHGALGMDIAAAQRVTDAGMTFDLIRITQVRRGSAGAAAGFHPGDEIIAVDGRVFASIAAFAGYVGSIPPGRQVSVDTIPAGGGPAQAERVTVVVGGSGGGSMPAQPAPERGAQNAQPPGGQASGGQPTGGMSTRTKIGIAAVALFGCYELGCFSHRPSQNGPGQSGPSQPGSNSNAPAR